MAALEEHGSLKILIALDNENLLAGPMAMSQKTYHNRGKM